MIQHVVLFQWKPEASTTQVEAAGAALLAMRGRIPEIRDIHFGPNLSPEKGVHTHVLIVVCDGMAGVDRYLTHPVHVETVVTHVRPILASRIPVDVDVSAIPTSSSLA